MPIHAWIDLATFILTLGTVLTVNAYTRGKENRTLEDQGEQIKGLAEDFKSLQKTLTSIETRFAALTGVANGVDYRQGE